MRKRNWPTYVATHTITFPAKGEMAAFSLGVCLRGRDERLGLEMYNVEGKMTAYIAQCPIPYAVDAAGVVYHRVGELAHARYEPLPGATIAAR